MGSDNETADEDLANFREHLPTPGVVLVWSEELPHCRAFAFRRRPLLVGRHEQADIALRDKSSSSRHAELSSQQGELIVRDDASRNGTFVNGERVQG